MPTAFRKRVDITPADRPEVAAVRLEAELRKLFPGGESFHEWTRFGKGKWSLQDPSGSVTRDRSVRAAFHEFREQQLEPYLLQGYKHGVAGAFADFMFTVYIHYNLTDGTLLLRVEGRDQVTVDGVKAVCERIKAALETPSPEDVSHTPNEEMPWWSRLVKEHLPMLVVGVAGTVIAALILSWFGFQS